MSSYSIKDLERLSGIKAHTLRIWEARYHLLHPSRSATNIRRYGDSDLKRILNVSLLNKKGYKISAISRLSEQELIDEVNKHLERSENEKLQIDTLLFCLLYMDEARFERSLNSAILNFGFEGAMERVVFPFLRQIGNMWQVGLVTPAQEHYISNLIRQKLLAGLDNLPPSDIQSKTFLFFLPENELHELGLIYLHYLAKSRNCRCYYLGQSVPSGDLISIARTLLPDYLVTVITSPRPISDITELFHICSDNLPSARLILSGRLLFSSPDALTVIPQEHLFRDFEEFRSFVGQS